MEEFETVKLINKLRDDVNRRIDALENSQERAYCIEKLEELNAKKVANLISEQEYESAPPLFDVAPISRVSP